MDEEKRETPGGESQAEEIKEAAIPRRVKIIIAAVASAVVIIAAVAALIVAGGKKDEVAKTATESETASKTVTESESRTETESESAVTTETTETETESETEPVYHVITETAPPVTTVTETARVTETKRESATVTETESHMSESVTESATVKETTGAPTPAAPKIPEGATYKMALSGETLKAGADFPAAPEAGDIYDYGDYEYRFAKEYTSFTWADGGAGWGVRAKDNTKTVYGEILHEIDGAPVTSLSHTFDVCRAMTEIPKIPDTVVSLDHAFVGCASLTDVSAVKIPTGVVNMNGAFQNCASLTVAPVISYKHTSLVYMNQTFSGCTALTKGGSDGAIYIPEKVDDLIKTFYGCESYTGMIYMICNPGYYEKCFALSSITVENASEHLAFAPPCTGDVLDAIVKSR